MSEGAVVSEATRLEARAGPAVRIKGSLLARNVVLSLGGQVVALMIAVVTMPIAIRQLGSDAFGIVALAWAVLGYFAVFDLGVSRAVTKLVAEHLGQGDTSSLPGLVWTSVLFQAILGLLGTCILWTLTQPLVGGWLKIPSHLVSEARICFRLIAVSVPLVLMSSTFFGVLEASQRFDVSVSIRTPSTVLNYLAPFVAALLGWGLRGVFLLFLAARLVTLLALISASVTILPQLRIRPRISVQAMRSLFGFGSWVTVATGVGFLLGYIDRFALGSVVSIGAVAFYSVPFEMVSKLWIIPVSLGTVLFPAFSTLQGQGGSGSEDLLQRALKILLLFMAPVVAVLIAYAPDVLRIWVGDDYAANSASVLRVLSAAALIGGWGPTLGGLLQGVGRPDMITKVYAGELVPYLIMLWLLAGWSGIAGVAWAASLRTCAETVVFVVIVMRLTEFSWSRLLQRGFACAAGSAVTLIAAIALIKAAVAAPIAQMSLSTLVLLAFAWFSWHFTLCETEKNQLLLMLGPLVALSRALRW